MARPSGELNRCGGRWTNARFNSFIKSLLRSGTRRWGPIGDVKREARIRRGIYRCSGCGEDVAATTKVDGKRVNNAVVDHIKPIIDPEVGFTNWDDVVESMFCEADNLQLLCYHCHTEKSNEERAAAKLRREREKNE